MSGLWQTVETAFQRLESQHGFSQRASQRQMAQFVCEQLESRQSAMVEAPTGVGKSLALLLPAIAYALQHDKRVVISTYTVLLAEQYWRKDLPLALELFPILVRPSTRTRRWQIGCVLNRFNPIRAGKPSTWGILYMAPLVSEGVHAQEDIGGFSAA